ncbi:hypothetical protein [Aliterella atlantica]|uniref:Uncharacterized protein n=1 Tax=Aliterella atlantica CENA595 TaxID=1618023 RepID=A0A0D8ZPY8_9CYAN|nr:hypothetical protein [Aliterella atlantica]KJH70579.1 hypothetical protein UH38_17595 [Aliterella atlantica CENA595]
MPRLGQSTELVGCVANNAPYFMLSNKLFYNEATIAYRVAAIMANNKTLEPLNCDRRLRLKKIKFSALIKPHSNSEAFLFYIF